LNGHLRGDSDDDDDGADEDEAETTDQTPPQDAAVSLNSQQEHPTTAAKCLALVPCGHQRFYESCTETVHQRGDIGHSAELTLR